MSYYNQLSKILDRYENGQEELDKETIFSMLEEAIYGLENCDKEPAYKAMIELAGYSVR